MSIRGGVISQRGVSQRYSMMLGDGLKLERVLLGMMRW